jgi:ssDNA-binding Zn-finger/Zn-ribbon topoisomerase 1
MAMTLAANEQSPPKPSEDEALATPALWDDDELLDLHREFKTQAFMQRQVFERQWQRNIFYVLGRQWIEYHTRDGQWKDVRLAKWVPRPVTNKCKTTVQAIRAMFGAIQIGVSCRPNGDDPRNLSVAATCDELSPLLHDRHNMSAVMNEFDWWLITPATRFLYTYWDYDVRYGMVKVQVLECPKCGYLAQRTVLRGCRRPCPDCQARVLRRMVRRSGFRKVAASLMRSRRSNSRSRTAIPRFAEVPFVYRLRWRPKSYFSNNPALKKEMAAIEVLRSHRRPQSSNLQISRHAERPGHQSGLLERWREYGRERRRHDGIRTVGETLR